MAPRFIRAAGYWNTNTHRDKHLNAAAANISVMLYYNEESLGE
jgi:hypothetical protein